MDNLSENLVLRKVTFQDAQILFEWRNDPETRKASRNTDEVLIENHKTWLAGSLQNKERQLYIVEKDSVPIGMVRADYDRENDCYELTWMVSPHFRGKGWGKHIVALLANRMNSQITAQIRTYNIASQKIAEFVEMKLDKQEDGFYYYSRPSVSN